MSASYGIFDLRRRISELVERAAAGEEIVITKRGLPMARIVPMTPPRITSAEERERIIREMREFREGLAARGVKVTQKEIKTWINEGRP